MRSTIPVLYLCLLVVGCMANKKQLLPGESRFRDIRKFQPGDFIRQCFAAEKNCCEKIPQKIGEECEVTDLNTGEEIGVYIYVGKIRATCKLGKVCYVCVWKPGGKFPKTRCRCSN